MTIAISRMECENHPEEHAVAVCVVCGKPVCGDCAISAEKSMFCDKPDHAAMQKEWILIATSHSEFEADAVCLNLAHSEIETKVFSMRDHVVTFWFDEFAIVRVFVQQKDMERALAVLSELQLIDGPASV
ncbi:MAG: B-box zinc finger protein [Ignavibacteriales bacterium]|nr:B-box zinc finger protein [Ignavibacteriales bacterium]